MEVKLLIKRATSGLSPYTVNDTCIGTLREGNHLTPLSQFFDKVPVDLTLSFLRQKRLQSPPAKLIKTKDGILS